MKQEKFRFIDIATIIGLVLLLAIGMTWTAGMGLQVISMCIQQQRVSKL